MAAVPSFRSVFRDSELIGRGALSTCVCATQARQDGVAQTLLSVLVMLGWMTVIHSRTMWNDRLRFAERVEKDWRALTDEQRAVAAKALETIDEDPIIGAPLFEPLRGYWSYRSEGIRIIYRIVTEARFIVVLNIGLVIAR